MKILFFLAAVLTSAFATEDALSVRRLLWSNVSEIQRCSPESPITTCLKKADPCTKATCPANPKATCISKTCYAEYRNVTLNPCVAIWHNATSGDLVDCSCKACGMEFKPVCSKDGNTYPNKCAAICQGKKVAKAGRCVRCKGADCASALLGELCIAGSMTQCLASKYVCKLPASNATDTFLGTCVNKSSAAAGSHHRRRRHLSHRLHLRH